MILDQLCVLVVVRGLSESLYEVVSYLLPNSSLELYKIHVNNISALVSDFCIDANQLMVAGDFNVSGVTWANLRGDHYLLPSNVSSVTEVYVVNSFLELGNCFKALKRLLDLVFIRYNIDWNIYEPLFHSSQCTMLRFVSRFHFINFLLFSQMLMYHILTLKVAVLFS